MSVLLTIWIGIFLLVSTGANIPQDTPNRDSRSKRMRMNKMLEASGNPRFKSKTYESFCGPAENGIPVDSLDSCCESHELCYKSITQTSTICEKLKRKNAMYSLRYDWKIINGKATCGDNLPCSRALCECDVKLVNCLGSNIDSPKTSYSTTPQSSTRLLQNKTPTTPQSSTGLLQNKTPTTLQSSTVLLLNKTPTTPQPPTGLLQNKTSTTPLSSISTIEE